MNDENRNNVFGQQPINQNNPFLTNTENTHSNTELPVAAAQPTLPATPPSPAPQPVENQNTQKIEIPQEYYAQLEKEKQEKQQQEQKEQEQLEKDKEYIANSTAGSLVALAILNAAAFIGIIYSYLNYNNLLIFLLPALIVVLTFINAIKNKKESDYPNAVLIGGILGATATFGLSMVKTEIADLLMYYAIVCVATGVIGMIISNIITSIIGNFKNIKALQTIGYIIVIAALIGAPVFLYNKYPEETHRYLFFEQIEVVAETEDEYIVKTLKNRYNQTFTCNDKVRNLIDQQKQKLTVRECYSSAGEKITVQSIEYEKSAVQYTIIDDYLDVKYFNDYKKELNEGIQIMTGANSVKVSLYSDTNCNLVADCAECDEYYNKKAELDDRTNMYKESTTLNFQKQMTNTAKEFVNKGKYKYVITVNGNYAGYNNDSYNGVITKVLDYLNSNSIKNNYGYEVVIKNANAFDDGQIYNSVAYKVKGTTNNEKTFKDPVVQE